MKLSSISKYSVIFSIVPALFVFFFPGKIAVISMLLSYPLIALMVMFFYKYLFNRDFEGRIYVFLYIVYNMVILVRGFIDATSQEDWNTLLSSMVPILMFLPLSIYFGIENDSVRSSFRTFFMYGMILSSILLFDQIYGNLDFTHMFAPIYLFILLIPYVSFKLRGLIIFLAVFSFFSDITVRANMLNILIAFIILSTSLLKRYRYKRALMNTIRRVMLFAPVILLVLGLTGVFNVFKISEYIGDYTVEDSKGASQDLVVDSRTGIYLDVILELNKEKAFIWGLGGSGKTDTYLTELNWGDLKYIYKEGRRGTESGMLNYAQWGGIVGVLVYLLLFFKASYLAVNKSNNWFCVMLGLWVAYKATFSFLEDRLFFNVYSLFIMIPIGMCFNESLRKMNDDEVKAFIGSFFKKAREEIKFLD